MKALKHIPYGITGIIITCFDYKQEQFSGIKRLTHLMGTGKLTHTYAWNGIYLNLSRRRKLLRVLVSGHASKNKPLFSSLSESPLSPAGLRLPRTATLYLMGCFQGRSSIRRMWAEGTGISEDRILGDEGETESALSTCLLLHLMEDGMDSLNRWFREWIKSNAYLRPSFPELRRIYREQNGQPDRTLKVLSKTIDLSPIESFVGIAGRYPEYLTDLIRQP